MYDVAIIGAGVVGSMIARELTKYRLEVCLAESRNDVAMGQSKANSAIVHAGYDAMTGTLKAKLNVRGSEMMAKVTSELGVKYRNNGALIIGFSDEDDEKLDKLLKRGQANGVKNMEIVGKERLHELEPYVSDEADRALWVPTSAIICPYQLTIAAAGNAMDNGAALMLNFKVTGIEPCDGGYRIFSGKRYIEAKYVINSAGVYSDAIAGMLGVPSPKITPRRGEYLLLDKTATKIEKTLFGLPGPMGKGILVSATVDRNTLLGPTAENISDKEATATTQNGLATVMRQANRMAKLPRGTQITSFAGLRASIVTADGSTADFSIEKHGGGERGAIVLCGIDSPGLSASPAIAEYVADLLFSLMKRAPEANDNFNPIREKTDFFNELSDAEKNRIIAGNPAFGRMICRCESITEGEIRLALSLNPRATDLDGVKRRTRAGMGRCQGGFCSPTVLSMIAREYGIDMTSVTKCGPGSEILTGRTK